jgi:hypothetical protein
MMLNKAHTVPALIALMTTLTSPALTAASGAVSLSVDPNVTATVSVTAAAPGSIRRLVMYVDGQRVHTCKASPCSFRWNTAAYADGNHALKVKRIARDGSVARVKRTVRVSNGSDTDNPTVVLNAPAQGHGAVSILSSAIGGVGEITALEINVDGRMIAEFPQASVSYEWDSTGVSDGAHTLEAVAYDAEGNYGSTSRNITVDNSSDNPPPGDITFPSDPVEALIGNLTPQGSNSSDATVAGYDRKELELAHTYAERFPEHPSILDANYYDLAFALYQIYYRTGDSYYLNKARTVARAWRDWQGNQEISLQLAGKPTSMTPPPRGFSTLGLAVYAMETGDAEAARIVNDQARLVEVAWLHYGDTREKAYSMIALLAANVLGKDHRAAARQLLDTMLAAQSAAGNWEDEPGSLVTVPYTLNYMNGLMMEALAMYDRLIGDTRIVPAMQKCTGWLWNTQWMSTAQSFHYGTVNSGTINTDPAAVLNGLFLVGWGWMYEKTGNPIYRTQGDEIFRGLVQRGTTEIFSVKQFDQVFRNGSRYMGLIAK